jgi:hypothetical protein
VFGVLGWCWANGNFWVQFMGLGLWDLNRLAMQIAMLAFLAVIAFVRPSLGPYSFREGAMVGTFAAIVLVVGCTESIAKQDEAQPKMNSTGQDTPQATLQKTMVAVFDGDYKSFDSCIIQPESVTRPLFGCLQRARSLRSALEKKFGKGAWDEFNKTAVNDRMSDLRDLYAERDVVVSAIKKGVPFTTEGETARCVQPWNGRTQRFRKAANGAWYADFGGGETKFAAAVWKSTEVGLNAALAKVTENGITISDVKREFEQTSDNYLKTLDLDKK